MNRFTVNEVIKTYNFAKGMIGKHRPYLQGSDINRSDKEIFLNDIQGKLAEIAVRKDILNQFPNSKINGDIDFSVYGRGEWDNYDLVINGKYLNIKSIKHFAMMLMVECERYNEKGEFYYTNTDNKKIINDYYILVKIKIVPSISWEDVKGDFEYFKNPYKNIDEKKEKIKREIEYEVVGGISHEDFWKNKVYLPKDTIITVNNMNEYILNGKSLEKLPDTKGEKLKVNNYGIHPNKLVSLDKLGFL